MSGQVDSFLATFFGDGNDLALESLAASNPALAQWLEDRMRCLRRSPHSPALLPRRRGDALTWYGLAHTARDRRELIQIVNSFVGPTYGSLRFDRPLDAGDPFDTEVQVFASHAFTFDVQPGQQADVRRALDLFFELEEIRPRRHLAVSRPLGRLLREFEMAVVAGSADMSAEMLEEIESTGQLSAQNVAFLRVRGWMAQKQLVRGLSMGAIK